MPYIKDHHDNSPLERMNNTVALRMLIRDVRDAKLDMDDHKAVLAAKKAYGATDEDMSNLKKFFLESNDAFEWIE